MKNYFFEVSTPSAITREPQPSSFQESKRYWCPPALYRVVPSGYSSAAFKSFLSLNKTNEKTKQTKQVNVQPKIRECLPVILKQVISHPMHQEKQAQVLSENLDLRSRLRLNVAFPCSHTRSTPKLLPFHSKNNFQPQSFLRNGKPLDFEMIQTGVIKPMCYNVEETKPFIYLSNQAFRTTSHNKKQLNESSSNRLPGLLFGCCLNPSEQGVNAFRQVHNKQRQLMLKTSSSVKLGQFREMPSHFLLSRNQLNNYSSNNILSTFYNKYAEMNALTMNCRLCRAKVKLHNWSDHELAHQMQREYSHLSENSNCTTSRSSFQNENENENFRKFPVISIEEFWQDAESEDSKHAPGCPVCLDTFRRHEKTKCLPCMHTFHETCIDQWFQRASVCPVCKHPVGALRLESSDLDLRSSFTSISTRRNST